MRKIKVYQYQLEKEGGERYGPSWMHRKECLDYLKKEAQPSYPHIRFRIKRYWVMAPAHIFKHVKKERVKSG